MDRNSARLLALVVKSKAGAPKNRSAESAELAAGRSKSAARLKCS